MTFFDVFYYAKTLNVFAYQKVCLMNLSFPDSHNKNAVMKYMHIPVLTPWYVYRSSHESVF